MRVSWRDEVDSRIRIAGAATVWRATKSAVKRGAGSGLCSAVLNANSSPSQGWQAARCNLHHHHQDPASFPRDPLQPRQKQFRSSNVRPLRCRQTRPREQCRVPIASADEPVPIIAPSAKTLRDHDLDSQTLRLTIPRRQVSLDIDWGAMEWPRIKGSKATFWNRQPITAQGRPCHREPLSRDRAASPGHPKFRRPKTQGIGLRLPRTRACEARPKLVPVEASEAGKTPPPDFPR